ncbi:MAG: PHP domain-containing protein [Kiritimatiellia bacterium]
MFNFDLHIHSCLSPCAALDSSPREIGRRAKEVGLDGIMLSDHNSSRNAPAMEEVCRNSGLKMLYGMELTTAEEAHCLAVFDTREQANLMTEYVYDFLPPMFNDPDVFGSQIVVDADEQVIEMEQMFLSAPTAIRIGDAGRKIHNLGGLFVAAHVDRPYFSVISQLGSLTGNEGFDAVEVSRHAVLEEWIDKCIGLPVLRNSDAHYVENIGEIYNQADLDEFSVAALKKAFEQGGIKHVRR